MPDTPRQVLKQKCWKNSDYSLASYFCYSSFIMHPTTTYKDVAPLSVVWHKISQQSGKCPSPSDETNFSNEIPFFQGHQVDHKEQPSLCGTLIVLESISAVCLQSLIPQVYLSSIVNSSEHFDNSRFHLYFNRILNVV